MLDIWNRVLVDHADNADQIEQQVNYIHYDVLSQDKSLVFFVEVLLFDSHLSQRTCTLKFHKSGYYFPLKAYCELNSSPKNYLY